MAIHPVLFYLFAGLAIAFALLTVLKKSPVSSAFSLVMVFFCFAAIYSMLDAHLIGALQVLVYAGAIMVLFIFVIMLLNADTPSLDLVRTPKSVQIGAVAMGLILLGTLVWAFKHSTGVTGTGVAPGRFTPEAIEMAGGNTKVISELMFSEYILPFELTSVLLLAGLVGAIAIAKRHTKKGQS